jgi:hypothetical protein
MTYGWSILIIAVVLGALSFLGIFNPLTFAPKASAGNCQIIRNFELGMSSMVGNCNNEVPQYVAEFSNSDGSVINTSKNNILSGASAFTINFWVNPKISGSSQLGFLDEECMIGIKFDQPNTIETDFGSKCWSVSSRTAFSNISSGKWIFIAITWKNGSDVVNYVDRFSKNVTGAESTVIRNATARNFEIGPAISDSYSTAIDGQMADVQVYNTSLDQNSILALYNEGIGGVPIDPQNLVAWWPLNGNANDYSGNGNDGISTNVIFTSNWYGGYTQP